MTQQKEETIQELFALVHAIRDEQTAHRKETAKYRKGNDRLIAAHKSAIQQNGDAIVCLKDYFLRFEERFDDDYRPLLEESVKRRRWWAGIYEEQKKRSVLVVTGVIAVAALFGLGNAVMYLFRQFVKFMAQAAA